MAPEARPAEWPGDLPLVRRLFLEYRSWLARHAVTAPLDNRPAGEGLATLDRLIEGLPGEYGPPRGEVMLWREAGELVACGALRELGPDVAEFKRLFIHPDYQGGKFGRPFAETLNARASALHYRKLRTDTLASMAGAIEFLEEAGFRQIEGYWPHPAAGALFFECVL